MILMHTCNPEGMTVEQITPAELTSRGAELLAAGRSLWIDLSAPTVDEETLVLQHFLPIHPLSFEDVTRLRREPESLPHFPKVEEFKDYLFVIVNPLTEAFRAYVDSPLGLPPTRPVTQLSAALTANALITHHYEPISCLDEISAYLSRHQTQAERGPDYVFHLILDATVGRFAPVLD